MTAGSCHSLGRGAFLQLDSIALHLVVEGWTLNAEEFGCFFLVTAGLCERLENGGSFEVVESLHAAAWRRGKLSLLQCRGQLYFRRELFHADGALSRQYDRVLHCVLQFANIPRP